MIVLLYMQEHGETRWTQLVTPDEMDEFFHRYLMEKEYRRRIDFADKDSRKMWAWNEAIATKIAQLIANMSMTKWNVTHFGDGKFSLGFEVNLEDQAMLHR